MNVEKQPLLSIVIPTKNRYHTLVELLAGLQKWDSSEFEVIIQDNTQPHSKFVEESARLNLDTRFRYFYTQNNLSAPENCDLAIHNATGKYVCFLGDDDGISQAAIRVCEIMKKKDIDSLNCNVGSYTWPDVEHKFSINKMLNGSLFLKKYTHQFMEVDYNEALLFIVKNGFQSIKGIPKVYHGLVSKRALDELYSATGTYFPGPVPDMSNAVGLCKYVRNLYYLDSPIIISGQSAKSMSGKNSVRKHQGQISQEKSLPADAEENWEIKLPLFWSAPNIWAEAGIKALRATSQVDLLNRVNYAIIYGRNFAFCDRTYFPLILNAMNRHQGVFKRASIFLRTIYFYLEVTALRGKIYLSKLWNRVPHSDKHNSIFTVMTQVDNQLENIRFAVK